MSRNSQTRRTLAEIDAVDSAPSACCSWPPLVDGHYDPQAYPPPALDLPALPGAVGGWWWCRVFTYGGKRGELSRAVGFWQWNPTSTRADLEERKERNIEALCMVLGIPYSPKPGDWPPPKRNEQGTNGETH